MGFEFAIWFLIGAALVFFMQCGFAMVESGFTRAKSAGNIIMKNLMDFCIGTPMFVLLGFGLMLSEDYVMGVIGVPNIGILTDFSGFAEAGRLRSEKRLGYVPCTRRNPLPVYRRRR